MITTEQIQSVIGQTMYGTSGDKIGTVGQVYLDDQTGAPEWATTKTGLFGSSETFVPLAGAQVSAEQLTVPYDKETVKGAPNVDPDNGHLSADEEAELYRYYGLDNGQPASDGHETSTGTVGHDTSGPTTDNAMTRSEEQLHVGTETRETGRARLRKYVVTENVTQTVPVSREEVRIEREPITDANRGDATSGADITEEEHEVTLHEERPVVAKETVPVERVRMDTDTVTGEEQVSEEVRKEQIEAEAPTRPPPAAPTRTPSAERDRSPMTPVVPVASDIGGRRGPLGVRWPWATMVA